jgi:hypothetical protein
LWTFLRLIAILVVLLELYMIDRHSLNKIERDARVVLVTIAATGIGGFFLRG